MSIDLTILFCVQLMKNKHHMDLSARHLKIRGSSASPDNHVDILEPRLFPRGRLLIFILLLFFLEKKEK